VILLLIIVLWPRFNAAYPGGNYILGDFWRTWLLAVSFAATLPISYSTFQGDYSRYLSPRVSDRTATWWNGVAMYLSNAIALLAGAFVTTVLTDQSAPWIIGTAAIVPLWFAVIVVLFGLIGTLPQGALCIYAAGLSANSILWRASRITSTLVVSVLGLAMLYLGAVIFDAIDSISAFVVIILILVSPWTAIMLVGFRLRRGHYHPIDLYAFTTGGGRYWYTAGLNPRALTAFVPAVTLGLLFASNSLYTGPLANLAGGIDLSLLIPFLTAGALYYIFCQLFPEHPQITP
jgi:purine-cytosine permease-like protein